MNEHLEANRANWDERTPVHLASRFYDVEGWLKDGRGPRAAEVEALGDVSGLRLLHLQCHIGLDTLSWARAGALVTGLDFSPVAIAAARELARRSGLSGKSEFVCADVYDAVEALGHKTFDIVYVSLGALCWLPRVNPWAEQVAALVAPGGRFYIHDGHPLADALGEERLVVENDYFEEVEPYLEDSEDTYTDSTRPLVNQRTYSWNHGIGETINSLIGQGLRLEWILEHDWTSWQRFPFLVEVGRHHWTTPAGMPRIPMSFSLLAYRP
ncbi:MAG: class I SAM-dependent methyltransferase [Acidimicrobiales bacterium]|jgi:SAM-dependent methyltransferase